MSNYNIITEAPNDTTLTIKGVNFVSIKAKDEIRDEKIVVEMVNNHYINIAEKLSLKTMQNIIQCYKNHPSIIKIKENFKTLAPFDFTKPTVQDISLITKSLNFRKATGPDRYPSKRYQVCFRCY